MSDLEYNDEFMRMVRFVASKAGITEEEVLRRVNMYVEEMSGLIKADGALYLVATDLNIDLPTPSPEMQHQSIDIGKLVPGMRKATVEGRIIKMYGILSYTNRSGERAERAEFKIADESGEIDVVIWSESLVELVKRGDIKEGDYVRISGARVSRRYNEPVLNLDSSSSIEIIEGTEEIPLPERKVLEVGEVYDFIGQEVDVKGLVTRIYPITEFKRSDGSESRRSSVILRDDDGNTTRVVFWGDKAYLVDDLVEGSLILLENVRVVMRNDIVELHSSPRTKIKIIEEGESGPREIKAIILYKFPKENVGIVSKKPFIDLLIESNDEYGILRLWGDWADLIESVRIPAEISVSSVYMSEDGVLTLSKNGEIRVLSEGIGPIPEGIEAIARRIKYRRSWIGESSDGLREFRGTVTWMSDRARVTWYCPKCSSRTKMEYGQFMCPNCGPVEEAVPLLSIAFTIDDGTGVARVVAFRDKAESILGMSIEEVLRKADELGETDYSVPTDDLVRKYLGKEIIVRGRASYLESGIVKLVLDEIDYVEPKEEIKGMIREIKRLWLR